MPEQNQIPLAREKPPDVLLSLVCEPLTSFWVGGGTREGKKDILWVGGIWAEAMVVCTQGCGMAEITFIEHLLCSRPCAKGFHSLII